MKFRISPLLVGRLRPCAGARAELEPRVVAGVDLLLHAVEGNRRVAATRFVLAVGGAPLPTAFADAESSPSGPANEHDLKCTFMTNRFH